MCAIVNKPSDIWTNGKTKTVRHTLDKTCWLTKYYFFFCTIDQCRLHLNLPFLFLGEWAAVGAEYIINATWDARRPDSWAHHSQGRPADQGVGNLESAQPTHRRTTQKVKIKAIFCDLTVMHNKEKLMF